MVGSVYFFLFYVLKGLTDPSHLRQSLTIQVSSSYIPRLLFRFILFRSLQFSGHAKCTKALRSVLLTHRSCSAPRVRIYIRRFITVPFFHDSKNEKKTKIKKNLHERRVGRAAFPHPASAPAVRIPFKSCKHQRARARKSLSLRRGGNSVFSRARSRPGSGSGGGGPHSHHPGRGGGGGSGGGGSGGSFRRQGSGAHRYDEWFGAQRQQWDGYKSSYGHW